MREPDHANGGRGEERTQDQSATATLSKAYVHEMLDFNPMWDAPQIIRRRRELWGGASVGASAQSAANVAAITHDPEADARLRERARRCLEKVQAEFYQLPKEKLHQYLRVLQSDRLPEYAALAARLGAAADVRDTLLRANTETGDVKFAYSLQQSVVRPAAEGAALREQYIESICDERRARPACAIIQKYVTAHPAVYALERTWFDMLLDPANQKLWSSRHARQSQSWNLSSGRSKGGVTVAVIIVLMIIRMVAAINRHTDQRPAPYTPPRPTPSTSPSMSPTSVPKLPGVGDPNQGAQSAQEANVRINELLNPRVLTPQPRRQNDGPMMEQIRQQRQDRLRSSQPDWYRGMTPDPFPRSGSLPPSPPFQPLSPYPTRFP